MGEKILTGVLVGIGLLAIIFLFGFINAIFVSLLWNWIIPIIMPEGPLIGTITYWQAWGISILCHVLIPRGFSTTSKSKD